MDYKFLDEINTESVNLPESSKINHFLLKNNSDEIIKALDFFASDGKFLYIHGFLGTGKRQFINYISEFLHKEVITLEYYCKPSTVCDDILLAFIDILEKNTLSKVVSHTAKITTLAVKFQQYVSSIKKPFVIILHSYDDIQEENRKLVSDCFKEVLQNENVKIIISTRAMMQEIIENVSPDRKIYLKALSKDIFREFMEFNKITGTDDAFNDFYKYSRGYYYYAALASKIMLAMELSLNDFLAKYSMSGLSFDSYLGLTYINLIPNTIRNFFWFLRTIRHGISLNALAILELYDDFSVNYLKNNLMIYQSGEVIYVQDYFQQDIDISIPVKTEKKLHKYIIGIYEKELKQPLTSRAILISRQALRAEIEYHNNRIAELENKNIEEVKETPAKKKEVKQEEPSKPVSKEQNNINSTIEFAKKLAEEKKYTDAIESYLKILDEFSVTPDNLAEIRVEIARLYYTVNDFEKAQHYFELAEAYYKKNNEFINLNYLYYELTELYFKMYKNERAIETAKKVIYSVDTPQSLMVSTCVLLGNIYSETENPEEAYKYYIKALESVDENTEEAKKAELYFKIALVCDEKEDSENAFEYYNKCVNITSDNKFRALAFSNLGACYYENYNYSDAKNCFMKAYQIEKENNNYDGIYYVSSYLAKISQEENSPKTLDYLMEAKQSAEFINEEYYVLESYIALGDYYYNHKDMMTQALKEYLQARKIAQNMGGTVDLDKIQERINDMKLRMSEEEFERLERKYE